MLEVLVERVYNSLVLSVCSGSTSSATEAFSSYACWSVIGCHIWLVHVCPVNTWTKFCTWFLNHEPMRLPHFFRLRETFFRKFFNVPKMSSLQFVWYFATERMLENRKGSFFQIFRHYETVKISLFFFQNFSKDSKRSPFSFFRFCNRMDVKKSQRVPLL